jgi:hypothetical protein
MAHRFLRKDLVLIGVAIWTLGDSLGAHQIGQTLRA